MIVPSSLDRLLIDDVTKVYRGGGQPANQGISLSMASGELVALIGHNGAGKTTLLNQIVGRTRPTAGDVRYGEQSLVSDPDLARRVASMMPQMYAPLTGVTPRQAISSIGRIRGLSAKAAAVGAEELLGRLDIVQWASTSGEKLSGGLRRLTSFAMAVTCPAPVLLVDEPTNDVDPVRRPMVWRHLRALADAGHLVIVVTHNLLEIERVADRFVLLQEGEVLLDASSEQLAEQTRSTTLTVSMRTPALPSTMPQATAISDTDDGYLRLTLNATEVPDAVAWVSALVDQGAALNYTLAPTSLETMYEGMTNAHH